VFPERIKRVEEQMQRELAIMLDREVKDPRIGMVTVSHVRVTRDLRQADVYVSRLGDDPQGDKDCIEGLAKASGYLRHQINERMRLKHIPELKFHLDTAPRHAMELEDIFRQIHEQSPAPTEQTNEQPEDEKE